MKIMSAVETRAGWGIKSEPVVMFNYGSNYVKQSDECWFSVCELRTFLPAQAHCRWTNVISHPWHLCMSRVGTNNLTSDVVTNSLVCCSFTVLFYCYWDKTFLLCSCRRLNFWTSPPLQFDVGLKCCLFVCVLDFAWDLTLLGLIMLCFHKALVRL